MVSLALKPLIKVLVLAPAVGGLVGFVTDVVTTAVSNLPSAVVTPAQAPLYALVIGAATFAIIVVSDLENIIQN